jgi:hypothetical protein
LVLLLKLALLLNVVLQLKVLLLLEVLLVLLLVRHGRRGKGQVGRRRRRRALLLETSAAAAAFARLVPGLPALEALAHLGIAAPGSRAPIGRVPWLAARIAGSFGRPAAAAAAATASPIRRARSRLVARLAALEACAGAAGREARHDVRVASGDATRSPCKKKKTRLQANIGSPLHFSPCFPTTPHTHARWPRCRQHTGWLARLSTWVAKPLPSRPVLFPASHRAH